jgi:hypothetical protein
VPSKAEAPVFLCRVRTNSQLIHSVIFELRNSRTYRPFWLHERALLYPGAVMRTMSFFLTASIFSSIFIGLALASAVITGAVHAQFASRSALMSVMQN